MNDVNDARSYEDWMNTEAAREPIIQQRVLCKHHGMLIVAEVSIRTDGEPGRCPQCGSTSFSENAGWTECDCGFAYLSSDVDRLKA